MLVFTIVNTETKTFKLTYLMLDNKIHFLVTSIKKLDCPMNWSPVYLSTRISEFNLLHCSVSPFGIQEIAY